MKKKTTKKPVAKNVIKLPKTARQVLDIIDQFLVDNGVGYGLQLPGRDLWDVLSALRGPDSECRTLKCDTTIPIRRAAFPKFAAEECRQNVGAAFGDAAYIFKYNHLDRGHFHRHAKRAARVLGL